MLPLWSKGIYKRGLKNLKKKPKGKRNKNNNIKKQIKLKQWINPLRKITKKKKVPKIPTYCVMSPNYPPNPVKKVQIKNTHKILHKCSTYYTPHQ